MGLSWVSHSTLIYTSELILCSTLCGIVCIVYHPPGQPAESHKELDDYSINASDHLHIEYRDLGLVLLDNFNNFNCSNLVCHHSLKQVVQHSTRDTVQKMVD